jgi:hypothetical protein
MSYHHNQTTRGNAGVKKSQLKKLVDNYYDVIKKKDENGNIVDLDRKTDAQSAWFSKAAIDRLFADHGCTPENNDEFGLRLYYAVHKTGVLHPEHEIPGHYHNQQTIVLVPTQKSGNIMDKDLLKNDDYRIAGSDGKTGDGSGSEGEGDGLNHTKLCPPETDCGCAI